MLAEADDGTVLALAPHSLVLADATAAAVFTDTPHPLVLADAATRTFFTGELDSLMLAESYAAAISAFLSIESVYTHFDCAGRIEVVRLRLSQWWEVLDWRQEQPAMPLWISLQPPHITRLTHSATGASPMSLRLIAPGDALHIRVGCGLHPRVEAPRRRLALHWVDVCGRDQSRGPLYRKHGMDSRLALCWVDVRGRGQSRRHLIGSPLCAAVAHPQSGSRNSIGLAGALKIRRRCRQNCLVGGLGRRGGGGGRGGAQYAHLVVGKWDWSTFTVVKSHLEHSSTQYP